jgi:hypothetical protein
MMTDQEIESLTVNGVTPPNLARLMSEDCTKEELQAALVKLICMFNLHTADCKQALDKKQNKPWRASF